MFIEKGCQDDSFVEIVKFQFYLIKGFFLEHYRYNFYGIAECALENQVDLVDEFSSSGSGASAKNEISVIVHQEIGEGTFSVVQPESKIAFLFQLHLVVKEQ